MRGLGLKIVLAFAGWGCDSPTGTVAEPAVPPVSSSAPSAWVAIGPPEDRVLLEAPAVVRAGAEASGDVAATVRLQVVRVHVKPGDAVAAGDAVVEVAAPELAEAAAVVAGALQRLAVHKARAAELEGLRADGLVSSQQAFEEQATVAELQAARDRAAAVLRTAGMGTGQAGLVLRTGTVTLRAPVAGVVAEVNVHPGEIREPGGTALARIIGTAPAHVEVRTTGPWPQAASVVFVGADGRTVQLAPTQLNSVVDRNDGTVLAWYAPVHGEVRLPDGLRGVAQLVDPVNVWEVPVGAVGQGHGGSRVVRRRRGAVSEIAVDIVTASGATAWVRPRVPERLRARDQVAADFAAHQQAGSARASEAHRD